MVENSGVFLALLLITLIIIAFFYLYFTLLIGESTTVYFGDTPIDCPSGACATNIYNGQKRCGSGIQANPKTEVCNSQFICDNPLTPYAVLSDNSTTATGTCEPNVTCRCLRRQQCADYIVAIFETIDGSPYTQLLGTRTAFVQRSSGVDLAGNTTNVPPLTYDDASVSFCAVPLAFLNRSSPGCNFAVEMNETTLLQCLANENPCATGTLAFLGDPDTFTLDQINTIPLACVRGNKCPSGQYPIWNGNLDSLTCKSLV